MFSQCRRWCVLSAAGDGVLLSAAGDGVCCLLQEMVYVVCMLKIVHWSCGVLLEICWCAVESPESPLQYCSMFL